MKIIKLHSRNLAMVSDRQSEGFLFASYEIGESVVGYVRTVQGQESRAGRLRLLVPMIMLSRERMAQIETEWHDGIKLEVIDGIYDQYVGFLRVKAS